MCQRRAWTKQEDQLLISIMRQQEQTHGIRKMGWNQIATKISEKTSCKERKGKQCRQRWFNQLNPNLNGEIEWSPEEAKLLFKLQSQIGSKWAQIARSMSGRSDNNLKNFFYSSLRKGLRRVNNYVTSNRQKPLYKNIKAFQGSTLNKILIVSEKKGEKKVIVEKQCAVELASDIKKLLVELHMDTVENVDDHKILHKLVQNIQEFNRICKRRKSKKKGEVGSESNENIQEIDSIYLYHSITQRKSKERQNLDLLQIVQSQVIEDSLKLDSDLASKKSKPLQEKQQSSEGRIDGSNKQLESEIINESVKAKQPTLPIFSNSNFENTSFISSLNRITKDNLNWMSSSIYSDPGIGFISMYQPTFYNGSGFAPTFCPPFMSYQNFIPSRQLLRIQTDDHSFQDIQLNHKYSLQTQNNTQRSLMLQKQEVKQQ